MRNHISFSFYVKQMKSNDNDQQNEKKNKTKWYWWFSNVIYSIFQTDALHKLDKHFEWTPDKTYFVHTNHLMP